MCLFGYTANVKNNLKLYKLYNHITEYVEMSENIQNPNILTQLFNFTSFPSRFYSHLYVLHSSWIFFPFFFIYFFWRLYFYVSVVDVHSNK